jgi:hypothetical protein
MCYLQTRPGHFPGFEFWAAFRRFPKYCRLSDTSDVRADGCRCWPKVSEREKVFDFLNTYNK